MDSSFTPPIGGAPLPVQSSTWAARPTASANTGGMIRVTDVGNGQSGSGGGTYFFANATRWKPVNNECVVDAIDTANVGVANTTEQQLNPNHVAIPAGLTADGDRFMIYIAFSKSSTVDTGTFRLRFGPLGTTADPIIAAITVGATAQSFGTQIPFKRISATTLQKQGNTANDASLNGPGTGAYPAAVAVSSMDVNPMFLSLTQQMTGGTEFLTVQDYVLTFRATDNV